MPNAGKPLDSEVPGPKRTAKPGATDKKGLVDEREIEGTMHDEEPLGWDQTPQDIKDVEQKRHPRPDGAGGLHPDKRAADPD
jgi:hypothetical protein